MLPRDRAGAYPVPAHPDTVRRFRDSSRKDDRPVGFQRSSSQAATMAQTARVPSRLPRALFWRKSVQFQ